MKKSKPIDLSLWLRQSASFYQQGKTSEAITLCRRAVQAKPDYAEAWLLLGTLQQRQARLDLAVDALRKAVEHAEEDVRMKAQLASALQAAGQEDEARATLLQAAETPDAPAAVLLLLSKTAYALQEYALAEACSRKVLEEDPQQASALNQLGKTLQAQGRPEEAKAVFEQLCQFHPNLPQAPLNLGHLLRVLGQAEQAEQRYRQAIALKPDWWQAHEALIQLHADAGNWRVAQAATKAARPHAEQIASFWELLSRIYYGLKQTSKSAGAAQKLLALKPDYALGHQMLAVALMEIGMQNQANEHFEKAVALDPTLARAWQGKAKGHLERGELAKAIEALEAALQAQPQYYEACYELAMARANAFQWERRAEDEAMIRATLEAQLAAEPLGGFVPVLSLNYFDLEPELHLQAAIHTAKGYERAAQAIRPKPYRHLPEAKPRLRIGYLSPDLRQHAVGQLVRDMFAAHDRSRFEVYAYSLVPVPGDAIQEAAKAGADAFFDVSQTPIDALAQQLYDDAIDILVDLGGYTTYTKPEALALRPAPVQVQYLGLLDTMGADFIDHTFADAHAVPEALAKHYHEQVWHLPCAFVASPMPEGAPASQRAEWGLPEEGFVFANFNGPYKYTPECFASWMRILAAVPGSVLWLAASGDERRQALRGHAQRLGIAPERLVFTERVPMERHLERMGHAGLFLDTFSFNAGAVGVSTLQAGLPLLTRTGNTYASRVGGSLCLAVGLPELVCDSTEAFERQAIALAENPDRLAAMRAHLKANWRTSVLFDMAGTVREMERCYEQMWAQAVAKR